jgi:hypothetical protein
MDSDELRFTEKDLSMYSDFIDDLVKDFNRKDQQKKQDQALASSSSITIPDKIDDQSVSASPVKKSRKGPAPKLFGNEKCKICQSKATGFHYNVLSCEACKNFFRRAIVHKLSYECRTGNQQCSVKTGHRPRCQYCRLMKCQESGMLAHYINRGKRKENVKKELEKGQQEMIKQISAAWSDSTNQIFENKPDSSEKPENNNQQQPPSFGFVSQCAVAKIQRIVDFCRKLPEWDSIDQAIQIKLIKVRDPY